MIVVPGFGERPGGGPIAHPLHDGARDWPETNCYVDVWIELLGGLGLEVEACLAFTLASDFEGDQWTFFKPPHADLERLYGIGVEELTLWRPLLEHVRGQVALGRIPLVEVDARWLPDTRGTSYHERHEKTTIGIVGIDTNGRRLRYLHNRGVHELEGADFDSLLRVGEPLGGRALAPYCEIVKLARLERLPEPALRQRAFAIARRHFARRPADNPVQRYERHFADHLRLLLAGDLATYHAYGFAAVRQLGAGFELLASHLRWLDAGEHGACARAADRFACVSSAAKTFLLKLARVTHARRESHLSSSFAQMAEEWQRGMDLLAEPLAS